VGRGGAQSISRSRTPGRTATSEDDIKASWTHSHLQDSIKDPQKQIKDSEEQQGSKDDTKDKLQSTTRRKC
jgi:hypothetical protein